MVSAIHMWTRRPGEVVSSPSPDVCKLSLLGPAGMMFNWDHVTPVPDGRRKGGL